MITHKHARYHFEDGSVQFLVEGYEYRLHRYLFSRDSSYWENIFAHGTNLENTFSLTYNKSADFDAFLSVLYATCYSPPDIRSVAEWSAVLRLSTEWSFDGIRKLALQQLEPIASPIEKIVLSHSQSIPEWRPAAYTALCQRPNPLTAQEIRVIHAEDVELIMSVREGLLRAGATADAKKVAAKVADAMKRTPTSAASFAAKPILSITTTSPAAVDPAPSTTMASDDRSMAPPPSAIDTLSSAVTVVPTNSGFIHSISGAAPFGRSHSDPKVAEPGMPLQNDARAQGQSPGIDLRFDIASLLSLLQVNTAPDVIACVAKQLPRTLVCTEVATLLDALTLKNIGATAHSLCQWASIARVEDDCATVACIIDLIYDKAICDTTAARACALLCRQVMDKISPRIQGQGVRECAGQTTSGGQLFRNRLLSKCKVEVDDIFLKMSLHMHAATEEDPSGMCIFCPPSMSKTHPAVTAHSTDATTDIARDRSTTTHERARAAFRFNGELAAARVLGNLAILDYLGRLLPAGDAAGLDEPETQLLCALLAGAGPSLNTGSPKMQTRLQGHVALLERVDAQMVSARTAEMRAEILQMQAQEWRVAQ
ncbi:hypothetical protein PsYK624_001300 [Phanerochaete sordida]|uniref:BTB domain-containing protein n=1 Tax=Phanerochaete sordida TaxID=48140 RepID=A0A9P3L6N7_9APHY|nr:hypothetical protein PsYK624_001300 [Phanerochaete sordida]